MTAFNDKAIKDAKRDFVLYKRKTKKKRQKPILFIPSKRYPR